MHRLAGTNLWAGLLCIAIGGIALILLAGLRMGDAAAMGPAFLPVWLARVLIGLGVAIAASSLWSAERLHFDLQAARPLLLVLGGIVAYAIVLPFAGFALTSLGLLLLAAAAGRDFRPREALIVSVVTAASATALFIVALKINIPVWPS